MGFRNPYHFVPVEENINDTIEDISADQEITADKLKHVSFDRYHEGTFSGRFVCRIETIGPVILGGEQTSDPNGSGYTRVLPFERNGKPAFPASSIRGCISSVAEAASNSALRVLENKYYSRRVSMKQDVENHVADYSAIGMIVKEDGKKEYYLKSLALPTLTKNRNASSYTIPIRYQHIFSDPDPRFKAYCYNHTDLKSGGTLDSYSGGNFNICYARLNGSYTVNAGSVTGTGGKIRELRGTDILLGLTAGNPVITSPAGGTGYTRGIVRSIYKPSRDNDIPGSKKHELFIPFSIADETDVTTCNTTNLFLIKNEAIEKFYRLAKDRDSETQRRIGKTPPQDPLPFTLKGSGEFHARSEPYMPEHGDIVFFVPSSSGNEVEEIFVSQIWRKEYKEKTFDFFKIVNQDLLPFSNKKECITPAEAMFGFVEINENKAQGFTRALSSRVSFTDGSLIQGPANNPDNYYEDEVKLKILASPKPPSPSFYFRKKNLPNNPDSTDCYISKIELNSNLHIPQGRKFYLNHRINTVLNRAKTRQENENQAQKNIVTPLKKDCHFMFRIEFDNLSKKELGLLIYSLNPSENFYHKLGMAKPLGFGTVKFHIEGLFLINRKKRYSVDEVFSDSIHRFHFGWLSENITENVENEFDIYEKTPGSTAISEDYCSPEGFKDCFIQTMSDTIKTTIELIGKPETAEVYYPLAQANIHQPENEGFQWFQNNDNASPRDRKGLKPLEFEQNDISRLQEN